VSIDWDDYWSSGAYDDGDARLNGMMRGFGGIGPGGVPMQPPPFWRAQCGARGPGLKHRHAVGCEDGHDEWQCCECGDSALDYNEPSTVMPPIDVEARLRATGQWPVDGPPAAMRPVPRRIMPWESDGEVLEKHLHEAKHVTGSGPTGTLLGPGRGALTIRQQQRLMAWAGWVRHLDNEEAASG